MKITKDYIEKIKNKVSGSLSQKDRENAMLDLLVEIRDLLTPFEDKDVGKTSDSIINSSNQ